MALFLKSRAPLDHIDSVGELLLLACVVLAPWVYGSAEDSVRYALCATLLVASCLLLADVWRRPTREFVWPLAIPIFAAGQLLLRQTVDVWATVEAALVGFAMAMTWLAVHQRAGFVSPNSGRRVAAAVLITCVAEAAFAAFQWSTDRQSLFGRKGDLQTMPFGSYVNHNNFAGLVAMSVPLALSFAFSGFSRSGKLTARSLSFAGLAMGLALTVVASGSRGGVFAMVLGSCVLALLSRRRTPDSRQAMKFVVPIVIVLVVSLFYSVPTATRWRLLTINATAGSVAYRINISFVAVKTFIHRPLLGSGLGAFADAAAPFKTDDGEVRSTRAEADLLEFLVEGGLGLTLLIVAFCAFAWRVFKHEQLAERNRGGRWLRNGCLAACATMVWHSLFDFGFRIPANALVFAALLGVATARSAPAESQPWRLRWLGPAVALIAAAACVHRSVGAAGEHAAALRANPESRLDVLQGLVDAHPYLTVARRQRALAWMALAYSRGRYDRDRLKRAEDDLTVVLGARPQWGEAWSDLAWARYFRGDLQGAKASMQKATSFDPTHLGIGMGSAQILAWSGDYDGARRRVAELRKLNPRWSRESARELIASWTKDPNVLAAVP